MVKHLKKPMRGLFISLEKFADILNADSDIFGWHQTILCDSVPLLISAIYVIKPHNVIFAQIGAGLNFYDHERDSSWILETVNSSERDVRRLVFRIQARNISVGYLGRSADDDPMFGTVIVHLEGKLRTGVHRDPFDLKA